MVDYPILNVMERGVWVVNLFTPDGTVDRADVATLSVGDERGGVAVVVATDVCSIKVDHGEVVIASARSHRAVPAARRHRRTVV